MYDSRWYIFSENNDRGDNILLNNKKNKIFTFSGLAALVLLAGCASNNIKSYRADPNLQYDFKNIEMKNIFINSVSMPEDDLNSIQCRMVGNIYLPQKMIYSQYISDALHKSLMTLNKLSDTPENAHTLTVFLTCVNFSSVSGKWYIDADITVDQNPAVRVTTVTDFGTAYIATIACQNTAEAFDEAVANFIKEALQHPEVLKNLN